MDTLRSRIVATGVRHHFIYSSQGPWAIQVADIRIDRCAAAMAAKGGSNASGRRRTSDILRLMEPGQDVLVGVNADFFSLQTGVPSNALVMRGVPLTPPGRFPLFAMDSGGKPHIAVFTLASGDSLGAGDPRLARASFLPFHPMEAVGGRPRLLRDSAVAAEIDTTGQASFRARNPRTAIGVANGGKRLVLVVVDGRRKGWSDGMTLRELADLMLALGARDALNLDGGGSSTMVVESSATKALEVVNVPSDSAGERTVGDALAIVKNCR